MAEWFSWQALRLFFGGLWARVMPLLARRWRELAIVLMALFIWHQRAQLAACQAFKADVKAATPKAAAAQIAVNHAPAARSQAIAEKSNAEAPAYYAAVRAAAAAHRVRPADLPRSPGPADLPGADPAATSVHGSDAASDLVCRPRAEDDQLVAAAGRAAEMRAIALGWLKAGIAMPAEQKTNSP